MGYFKNIFKVWKASSYWVKALIQFRRGNHAEALMLLDNIVKYRRFRSEHYIVKGVLLFHLNNVSESINALQDAFANINKDKCLNDDEKKYLSKYIIYFLNWISHKQKLKIDLLSEPLTDNTFCIRNVSKEFLNTFPMVDSTVDSTPPGNRGTC